MPPHPKNRLPLNRLEACSRTTNSDLNLVRNCVCLRGGGPCAAWVGRIISEGPSLSLPSAEAFRSVANGWRGRFDRTVVDVTRDTTLPVKHIPQGLLSAPILVLQSLVLGACPRFRAVPLFVEIPLPTAKGPACAVTDVVLPFLFEAIVPKSETANDLESSKNRRSSSWHGNQHVCLRGA
jgi:hypothetical protein